MPDRPVGYARWMAGWRWLLLSFVLILFSSCKQDQEAASHQDETAEKHEQVSQTIFENRYAADIAATLKTDGFVCVEGGRELYPLYYACEKPDSGNKIYLYCDDANQVEVVKAFVRRDQPHAEVEAFFLYTTRLVGEAEDPGAVGRWLSSTHNASASQVFETVLMVRESDSLNHQIRITSARDVTIE